MATIKTARGTAIRKPFRVTSSVPNNSNTTINSATSTTTPPPPPTTTPVTQEAVVTSSTSTTSGRNPSETVIEVEELRALYYDIFDRAMPRLILRQVEQAVKEDDTAYWYYRYAMTQTAYANRPSWQYTMAIMARLHRENTPVEHIMFY